MTVKPRAMCACYLSLKNESKSSNWWIEFYDAFEGGGGGQT